MSKPTESFVAVARRYCSWAESAPLDHVSETRLARALLSELYFRALALPHTEPTDQSSALRPDTDTWRQRYERFGALPIGYYALVADPLAVPPQAAVAGDLADDLADIYSDLRAGFSLLEQGLLGDATWEWRFHFETHWGSHALCALQALHAYDSSSTGENSGAA